MCINEISGICLPQKVSNCMRCVMPSCLALLTVIACWASPDAVSASTSIAVASLPVRCINPDVVGFKSHNLVQLRASHWVQRQ